MILMPPGARSVFWQNFATRERTGYLLPPYQIPMVLPLKSAGFLMPVSARQVSSRPDFLKVCEILTTGTPFSRPAIPDAAPSTTTSAPPPAITSRGPAAGPPGLVGAAE